jgi:DNA modification methylase
MKTFLNISNKKKTELPKEYQSDDVRYTEELVHYFLKEFTKEGDVVFDPFAGYGTTLVVAEKMNRIPFGIEYESKRGDYIKERINNKENLIIGSSLELDSYSIPQIDFCFTSPPYMTKDDKENPFSSYHEQGSYSQYLADIENIYSQIKKIMKKGGNVGIEVSNLKNDGEVTTLAWDIAHRISNVLHFEGEIIIVWKNDTHANYSYNYGYDHSYVLMFKNV